MAAPPISPTSRDRRASVFSQSTPNTLFFDTVNAAWVHDPTALRSAGAARQQQQQQQQQQQLQQRARPPRWRLWLFLVVAAIAAAALGFACCAAVSPFHFIVRPPESWTPVQQLVYHLATCTALSVLAYSVVILLGMHFGKDRLQLIGGSGIPELTCELNGVHLSGIYNWRTMVAKLAGLALACGAGLPVGMEGPIVHATAGVGHLIMSKVPVFRELVHRHLLRHMALTVMVALGVASFFGAPLGGVLFALELTGTFASAAYLHCLFGATVVSLLSVGLRSLVPATSIFHFEVPFRLDDDSRLMAAEVPVGSLALHIALGMLCGVLGAAFVRLHQAAARVISRQPRLAVAVAALGLANALISWCLPVLRHTTQTSLLNKLINTDDVDSGERMAATLSTCFVLKFIATVLTLALPLPMGAIAPAFVLGALFGRAFGELLSPLCTGSLLCPGVDREQFVAEFAVVGASAFVAGSMRSFAQVIVVFERTMLPWLLLPVCSASLAAIFVGNALTAGFFDSVIKLKQLPHLPSLVRGPGVALTVADVMTPDFPALAVGADPAEMERVRGRYPSWEYEVPLVMCLEQHTPWGRPGHGKGGVMLVSALEHFPSGAGGGVSPGNVVVPLQVPCHTTVKSLLPVLTSLEKTVAFVVQDSHLVGAVTFAGLHSRVCDR